MSDRKLSAAEYLGQLQMIDTLISQKIEELSALKETVSGARAIDYSKDRVQTSPKNSQEAIVCKYVDLNEEINGDIDRFVDAKHQIIKEIQALHVDKYMKVLFKVYVQYKSIHQAADEIGISYSHARKVHKEALAVFEERYKNLFYFT